MINFYSLSTSHIKIFFYWIFAEFLSSMTLHRLVSTSLTSSLLTIQVKVWSPCCSTTAQDSPQFLKMCLRLLLLRMRPVPKCSRPGATQSRSQKPMGAPEPLPWSELWVREFVMFILKSPTTLPFWPYLRECLDSSTIQFSLTVHVFICVISEINHNNQSDNN